MRCIVWESVACLKMGPETETADAKLSPDIDTEGNSLSSHRSTTDIEKQAETKFQIAI